jgi:S-adenosyl methyltransferase
MGRAGLRSQMEDGRHAEDILTHSDTQRLINFDEPVAVLYISFLRQIPDTDDAGGLVRLMMSRLVLGSFVAISQLVSASPAALLALAELQHQAEGGRGDQRDQGDGHDGQALAPHRPVNPSLPERWHAAGRRKRGALSYSSVFFLRGRRRLN